MISPERAALLARRHFALDGTATPLAGEVDHNFRIDTASGSYVLKVRSGGQDPDSASFLDAVLQHLAERAPDVPAPRPVPAVDGRTAVLDACDGLPLLLRCLTWIEGTPWAASAVDPLDGPYSLGGYLARLDRALEDFDDGRADRELAWDMRAAGRHADSLALIEPAAVRKRVSEILGRFEHGVVGELLRLPAQLIHNDANDHNIIMDDDGRVRGVIDFGDAVLGQRVTEIAVACAYAMCGSADPFQVAARIVSGYHSISPLNARELALVPDLVETRAAMSLAMSARQTAADPGNDYLAVSRQPFIDLLDRLAGENRELVHYRLRDACGLAPHPDAPRIARWLAANRSSFEPVCDHDLGNADNLLLLDLSTDGEHATAMRSMRSTDEFTRYIFERMAARGASVGIGWYLEKRGVYSTDAYATADPAERRDRHLGVDLFLPAGEPVRAPVAGVVEATANNAAALDFGPTVILRHETGDGTPFWTLYGHLSLETLDHVSPGDAVAAGEVVGWIGDAGVNGGWPPHLHFQVMASLLGMGTGIHGVGNDALLDAFASVFIDPTLVLGTPMSLRAEVRRTPEQLVLRRRIGLPGALSTAYRQPLKIVRGEGQYLFDDAGNRYLDMVNNVCHVGHCHPAVVASATVQMRTLNTNTRYLHDNIVELAARLSATLPDPLSVCFFVNSGSEANDLALRLARTHTGRRDVLVLEHAYHGNLSALVDISPYKFDGPGGAGRPVHTRVCTLPDVYRGRWRRGDPDAGERYAESVRDTVTALAIEGRRPAAFIAESLAGVGGQLVPPPGYLAAAYRHARAAGAVVIADEVQVGLGRVGESMWAFETQGVVPDIVTIGKPLGNGHPLAAVVTTAPIAASFDNGMEYFNTFGGNPVSCATGLAVLDAIVTGNLVENARARGAELVAGLQALARRYPIIGDVRGLGLFIGAELVRDRDTLEPAAAEARAVVEHLRHRGVLLATEGPFDNVFKIKPPMCLAARDVELFLERLDDALAAGRTCRSTRSQNHRPGCDAGTAAIAGTGGGRPDLSP